MKTKPISSTPKENSSFVNEPIRKIFENDSLNSKLLSSNVSKLYEIISQKDDEIEKLNKNLDDQIRDNRFLQKI